MVHRQQTSALTPSCICAAVRQLGYATGTASTATAADRHPPFEAWKVVSVLRTPREHNLVAPLLHCATQPAAFAAFGSAACYTNRSL